MTTSRIAVGWASAVARCAIVVSASGWASMPASGAEAKRDFRGLEPGMSVAQAVAAAGRAGFACATSFTALTSCRSDAATVTLQTTGRNANRVYELRIVLSGHYESEAMMADLTRSYALRPTSVPNVYATAAGQQLMVLATGGSQTAFYLLDDRVLRDDAAALPPPRL